VQTAGSTDFRAFRTALLGTGHLSALATQILAGEAVVQLAAERRADGHSALLALLRALDTAGLSTFRVSTCAAKQRHRDGFFASGHGVLEVIVIPFMFMTRTFIVIMSGVVMIAMVEIVLLDRRPGGRDIVGCRPGTSPGDQ
jgi:hypothetical protein